MKTIEKNFGFIFFLVIVILAGGLYLSNPSDFNLDFGSSDAPPKNFLDDTYKRAREFNASGDYENAIIQYTNYIGEHPDDADAYENRCWAYYRLYELNHALNDCSKAIEINPIHVDALQVRCMVYQELRKLKAALDDCNLAVENSNSSDYASYIERADVYRRMHQYDKALADFDVAIARNPSNATIFNNRALVHRAMDNDELALADYTQSLKFDITSHVIWYNRARLYHDLARYDEAIEDYREAIDLYPSYLAALDGLGDTYYDLARLPDALELYKTIIRLEENGVTQADYNTSDVPAKIDNIQKLINAWKEAGFTDEAMDVFYQAQEAKIRENYPLAIDKYTELIELAPDMPDIYLWRAEAYEQEKDFTNALADYQTFLDKNDSDHEEYYETQNHVDQLNPLLDYDPSAIALYLQAVDSQIDYPEQSIDLLTQAIEIDSTFWQVLEFRGTIYLYQLEDEEKALADFQRIVDMGANSDTVDYQIDYLEPLVALSPEARECLDSANTTYDSDEKILAFTCVIDLAPDNSKAYYGRAYAYNTTYQYAKAVADYKTYLEMIPPASDDPDEWDQYYEFRGDAEFMIEFLQKYLDLPPAALESWVKSEEIQHDDEQMEQRIVYLSEVLEIVPDFEDALYWRAIVYEELGDYEKSLVDYKHYMEVVSKEEAFYFEYKVKEIEQVLKLPQNLRLLYAEASYAKQKSEYDIARSKFTELIEAQPDFALSYFMRSQLSQYSYPDEPDFAAALADVQIYLELIGEDDMFDAGDLPEYYQSLLDVADESP